MRRATSRSSTRCANCEPRWGWSWWQAGPHIRSRSPTDLILRRPRSGVSKDAARREAWFETRRAGAPHHEAIVIAEHRRAETAWTSRSRTKRPSSPARAWGSAWRLQGPSPRRAPMSRSWRAGRARLRRRRRRSGRGRAGGERSSPFPATCVMHRRSRPPLRGQLRRSAASISW